MTPPSTVVFLHAHPDDEVIFTGGTMLRLARTGYRVVIVMATSGELGEVRVSQADGTGDLGRHRRGETEKAAAILGAGRVEFLGYHDSGMPGDPANDAPGSFAAAPVDEIAERVAGVLRDEGAACLVVYDAGGIYGHPDHVQVHRAGLAAAAEAGVNDVYQATVDREYLHFVETHLVAEAGDAVGRAGVPMPTVGVPTVFVSTTVDVRAVLDEKRRALAAHASQVPETSSAMSLRGSAFTEVYGYEWYVRDGPPGLLDRLVETG